MTADIAAPTAQELQAIAEQEQEEEAIESIVETTRAGRKVKATPKVVQRQEGEKARRGSSRGSRGGNRGGKRGITT